MASGAAPLRFDDALLQGALPPLPPGHVRTLSQTLSPAALRVCAASTAGWNAQRVRAREQRRARISCTAARPPPWACLLSPLTDSMADEQHILEQLRLRLDFQQACAQSQSASSHATL
jgi:hypothetical protein